MKRGISVSLILATAVALALPRQAFAWADEGHMTVALVAQEFLTPTTA